MRLIDADKILADFPIREGNYDKENGSEDFIMGIETVLEYIDRIADEQEVKQKTKMTNAEKLAKDTNAMEYLIEMMCSVRGTCIGCPVKHTKCMDGMQTREWLESEVDEDDRKRTSSIL